ncbi:MAG TPA: hypothetical protein VIE44_05040 [Methylomirabilota bacterium]
MAAAAVLMRRLGVRLALGLCAIQSVAGCATGRIEQAYVPGGPVVATPARPMVDPFPYERQPARVTNHVEGMRDGYVVRLLRFQSLGDNGQPENMVSLRYFERAEGARVPLVLILPIWGGSAYPPAIVARDLVARGQVNVMRVLGEETMMDWGVLSRALDVEAFRSAFRQMVRRVESSVVDLRRLLDWAETRPAVDARRIAVVGFSESTLQAAGLMASDPRLAAAVVVMGGASPHEILATCYGPPGLLREEVMARFGWSRAQYSAFLAPLVRPIDPAYLGSRLGPDRVLLFHAERDDCVPESARDLLWQTAGRPTRVIVRSTHAGSFLGMTFLGGNHIRHRILQFLTEVLR